MEKNSIYPGYPYPYKIINGCLFREVQTRSGSYDQKLCNFLPYIVSEVTLDNGAEESRRLRLGGLRQNGSPLPEIEVTGTDLSAFNWLIEKWGADCVLEVGPNVRDSVRYSSVSVLRRREPKGIVPQLYALLHAMARRQFSV